MDEEPQPLVVFPRTFWVALALTVVSLAAFVVSVVASILAGGPTGFVVVLWLVAVGSAVAALVSINRALADLKRRIP